MVIVRAWCVGALITTFVRLLVNTVFPPPADTVPDDRSSQRPEESDPFWREHERLEEDARLSRGRQDPAFPF
ncbi:unnamed protein product [Knipowitschia caucasica]|uniref:Secreted protein n=1 Tax=Knipowitschia caucasica TaxID=637954 RepID=A0AAV2JV58_KNICA